MTPKEILLAAAALVENTDQRYACIALKEAAGLYDDGPHWCGNSDSYWAALHKFTALYKPPGISESDAWFPQPSVDGARQQRVEALLATAATFD